jgi:hypothetical protein
MSWQKLFENPSPVQTAVDKIRRIAQHNEILTGARPILDTAARYYAVRFPREAEAVMERIGNWPSSEPELAALQRVWK